MILLFHTKQVEKKGTEHVPQNNDCKIYISNSKYWYPFYRNDKLVLL